jgi:hypothetical protein
MTMGTYYAVGALYIVVFLLFATKHPKWALALSFGLAPIQRALPGLPAKMTLADFNMTMAFGVFALKQLSSGKPLRWGPLALPSLLYLVLCGISSISDWNSESTGFAFIQMVPYFSCSVILFSSYGTMEDLRPAIHLLIGVGMFFAVSTIIFFTPNIYGMNKNGLGASLACVTIVTGELWFAATDVKKKRIYLFCLVIVITALLITLSRGSWLAALSGLLILMAMHGEFKILARSAMVFIPLIAIVWAILPAEDKIWATNFDKGRDNIGRRIDFINDAYARFQREPIFGAGVGLRKNMDATNVVMMSLAESGVVGLAAFMFMHIVVLRMAWQARKGLRHSSWSFSCLGIGLALLMAKLIHALVDHYWSRGSLSLAWAGAGLVTRAWYESRATWRAQMAVQRIPRIPALRRRRPPRDPGPAWPGPATDLPPRV